MLQRTAILTANQADPVIAVQHVGRTISWQYTMLDAYTK
jgi:hypothetical protein